FTGKETVKDMNLVNMNARYYAPSLGRFMAYDPAPPEVDNIFSFNRYAYANNNPLRYIDPTGLWSISGMFSGDTGHDIADHANSFASGMNKGISGGLVDQKYNRDHQIDHMVGETLGMVVGMGIGTTEARIATEAGGLIKSAITAVMEEKNVAGQVNAARGAEEVEQVGRSVNINALQAKNLQRFSKKIPANAKVSVELKALPNDGVAAQATSFGKAPGSKAVYEKQIDSLGNTTQYTKTTYNPEGNIIHVKDKMNGETYYG
ncbi:RHS repeat-associated core domain-containing protein, partial [Cysteiniphilum litorale]|uniref:RHS repeat-associated core domain-containing protein n=2 Tax=Cysteiniphilum TaxID=2056696 RepID=UPI0019D4C47F